MVDGGFFLVVATVHCVAVLVVHGVSSVHQLLWTDKATTASGFVRSTDEGGCVICLSFNGSGFSTWHTGVPC